MINRRNKEPISHNKHLQRAGASLILVISLLCSGCGGYTRYNLKNTTYDEAWQACVEVRDEHKSMDVQVKRYGMTAFETKADKEKGIMSFATGELLFTHLENTIKLKNLGDDTVQVSVRSVGRVIFLPGLDRHKDAEDQILSEIQSTLEEK
ncbi:hypothetical protein ACFL4E_03615 [Candidatus Omnitrophota bacterium]